MTPPALEAAWRERVVAAGYIAAWRTAGRLREERLLSVARRGADRMYERDGRGVQMLRGNLGAVLGEDYSEDCVRDGVRSYLRYWAEAFRLQRWPMADLVERTVTVHEERLRAPYEQGRGVIVALPHQANWDWAGAWACATGMPLMTVAERLRPERLYDEFVAFRESLGMRILPLTGGQPPLPQLEAWLRDGGFVCLLADRDLSASGVEVRLAGQAGRMPPGAELLARATGAPLVPATLSYDGPRLRIHFHEAVETMQGVADAFTEGLREAPQDWHMMQRVLPGVGPMPRGTR